MSQWVTGGRVAPDSASRRGPPARVAAANDIFRRVTDGRATRSFRRRKPLESRGAGSAEQWRLCEMSTRAATWPSFLTPESARPRGKWPAASRVGSIVEPENVYFPRVSSPQGTKGTTRPHRSVLRCSCGSTFSASGRAGFPPATESIDRRSTEKLTEWPLFQTRAGSGLLERPPVRRQPRAWTLPGPMPYGDRSYPARMQWSREFPPCNGCCNR
jgi:hypothetical protein